MQTRRLRTENFAVQMGDFPASLITNFHKGEEEKYKKAIKQFPDRGLEIQDKAYDGYGRWLPGYKALHKAPFVGRSDLSDFWRYFETLGGSSET